MFWIVNTTFDFTILYRFATFLAEKEKEKTFTHPWMKTIKYLVDNACHSNYLMTVIMCLVKVKVFLIPLKYEFNFNCTSKKFFESIIVSIFSCVNCTPSWLNWHSRVSLVYRVFTLRVNWVNIWVKKKCYNCFTFELIESQIWNIESTINLKRILEVQLKLILYFKGIKSTLTCLIVNHNIWIFIL